MLFRRKRLEDQVVPGAVFLRMKDGTVVERATVAWVGQPGLGIRHVRFHVEVPGYESVGDTKVLALTVFVERYQPQTQQTAA